MLNAVVLLAMLEGAAPSAAPEKIARRRIDAVGRKDPSRLGELSAFPLVIRGLWDRYRAHQLAACGGRANPRPGANDSELVIPDKEAFDKAAPCLIEGSFLAGDNRVPPLRDGTWPPNRGDPHDGTVGTIVVIDVKRIPRVLQGHSRAVKLLVKKGTLVQVILTDNDGLTDTLVLIADPGDHGGTGRVRAVLGRETFED